MGKKTTLTLVIILAIVMLANLIKDAITGDLWNLGWAIVVSGAIIYGIIKWRKIK